MKYLYYGCEGILILTVGILILGFVPSLLMSLVLAGVSTGLLSFLFTYFDPFYGKE